MDKLEKLYLQSQEIDDKDENEMREGVVGAGKYSEYKGVVSPEIYREERVYVLGKSIDKTRKSKNKDKSDISDTVLDAPFTVDVIENKGKIVFLTETGEVKEKIIKDGIVYKPPEIKDLYYLLAQKDEVLELLDQKVIGTNEGDAKLYEELYEYHKKISDLPHKLYYDLLVLWDFHTYFLDKLHFSPMLYLYAVKERGKSRTAKGCLFVARRGIFTETIREADLIRWGNDHKAAIGFDSKDFPKKIFRANCDDLILSRFEKGSIASRTLWPERGAFRDTKTFKIFGATVIATNRPVDDVLESRTISINMKPSFKFYNKPVLPEDGLALKNKLTAFKYIHKDTKLIEVNKPTHGRLGDILSPLQKIVLTFFPHKAKKFKALTKLIIAQKKEESTETIEAQVVEAVIKAEKMVEKGFVSVDTITSLFNEGRGERFEIDVRTIGKILKGLGFSSRRNPERTKRGIFYDPKLAKNIALQYGIIDIPPPVTTSDMSETSEDKVATKDIEEIFGDVIEKWELQKMS